MDAPYTDPAHLTWANVGLGFSFILLDAVLSKLFNLRIEGSLVSAALRCIIQLATVGLILQRVFEANHPLAVAGIACMSC